MVVLLWILKKITPLSVNKALTMEGLFQGKGARALARRSAIVDGERPWRKKEGSTHSCRHLVGKCAGREGKGRRHPGPATRRPLGRVTSEGEHNEERRLSEPALRHPGAGRQARVRDRASRQRGRDDAAEGGEATASSGRVVLVMASDGQFLMGTSDGCF